MRMRDLVGIPDIVLSLSVDTYCWKREQMCAAALNDSWNQNPNGVLSNCQLGSWLINGSSAIMRLCTLGIAL